MVGKTADLAFRDLRALGFKPATEIDAPAAFNNICTRPLDASTVLTEDPLGKHQPGREINLSFSRYQEVPCNARARHPTAPLCTSHDLRQHVYGGSPQFTGGSNFGLIGISVRNRTARPCRLHTTFVLTITRAGVPVTAVSGAPAIFIADRDIGPGVRFNASWLWSHWCGSRDGVEASVRLVGGTDEHRMPRYVVCDFGGHPDVAPYSFSQYRK